MARPGPPGKTCYTVGGTDFVVDSRYVIEKFVALGKGAYGTVVGALDTQTGEKVAIKKIGNVFAHPIDAKRVLREMKLLRHFNNHENIVQLKDIMIIPAEHERSYNELYVVTELMDTDLHQIIKSRQSLSEQHYSHFLYQVFRALKYIHSASVLHRDIKPSNLVLNANCDMKICDFGLARTTVLDLARPVLTEYVTTRWYRAPEIIYDNGSYTTAVDIWAVGCIFAELIGKRPLFPGRDQVHQLALIMNTVGTPTAEQALRIKNDNARVYVQNYGFRARRPIAEVLPMASPEASNLIDGLLAPQPEDRLTAEEALSHPYFADLHDAENEPSGTPFEDFAFEDEPAEIPLIRAHIYREMLRFHPELRPDMMDEAGGAGGAGGVAPMAL